MRYEDLLEPARRAEFFRDEKTVEEVVQAVLGTLVSRLDEVPARRLTAALPAPLTYEKLKSQYEAHEEFMADQYVQRIADHFNLRKEHALRVVTSILWVLREKLPAEVFSSVTSTLPSDWRDLLETGQYSAEEEIG